MSMNQPAVKYNYVTYSLAADDAVETNSIFSDDQSLYVLFNPKNVDSDILSTTNSNRTDRLDSVAEESFDNLNQSKEEHGDITSAETSRRFTSFLEGSASNSLDKVRDWNPYEEDLEEIDENIASWNLDEQIERAPKLTKQFYGDELFKDLNKKEFQEFRRVHQKYKLSLNDKTMINQALLKVMQSYKKVQIPPIDNSLRARAEDYINRFSHNVEFSDTTSSLVFCGGNSSWDA